MSQRPLQTPFNALWLMPLVLIIGLLAPMRIARAQQTPRPITKTNLLASIEQASTHPVQLSPARLIALVKKLGVDFPLTFNIKQAITEKGTNLEDKDLEAILNAISDNYRPLTGERLRLSLFNYVPCDEHRQLIAEVLQSKVIAMQSRLAAINNKAEYVRWLKLVQENSSFGMSGAEATDYMNATSSLQLLEGTCTRADGDVLLNSFVFWANQTGPSTSLDNPIQVRFKLNTDEFAVNNDVHSLLILYSLALDARRTGKDSGLVMTYLGEAQSILKQIKNPESTVPQPIVQAISTMIEEEKQRQ